MTNKELLALYEALGGLTNLVGDPDLIYALVLLRKRLEAPAEALKEALAAPKGVQEYEQRRHALCREFSEREADGKQRIDARGHYIIEEDRKTAFVAAMQGLTREYQTDIDRYNALAEQREALWLRVSTLEIFIPKIPLAALQGRASFAQIEALFPIIEAPQLTAKAS